ncbi:hypothetical protein D8674_015815 [Pyrus ussuriensis x Pyrus communis]|uniref:Uncharacterized protein n=1 Tax=Pyrus ussuriensis x Pyrus communis TaxID=2448454 RepID=A0A5N5H890_9ROSA|nr:hypothetical protein D8674_015815 [Pyrus ussuriensis x Pyrus communis]
MDSGAPLVSSPAKLPFSPNATTNSSSSSKAASSRYFSSSASKSLNVNVLRPRVLSTPARRRALRYDDDDGDEDDKGVEYGHNKEIAVLELYSQCERRSTYCACNG